MSGASICHNKGVNFRASATFAGLNQSVAAATIRQATRLSSEQGAYIVFDVSQSLVHVDTGELKASGHVEVVSDTSAAVIYDSDHAMYNEYGTGIRGAASPGAGPGPYDPNWPGMAAIPFLRPALDSTRPEVLEVFRDNMAAAVKLLGRG